MIRIHKPGSAPRILAERGAELTAELCRKADAGERLDFEREVYGAAEVKQALRIAQHDKCCFCEAKLGHTQFGDVEHFRPKAGSRQRPDDRPMAGYYWLAYAWANLYLSCEVCNRRHKGGLFPLANPAQRRPRITAPPSWHRSNRCSWTRGARIPRRSSSSAGSTPRPWRGARAAQRRSRHSSSTGRPW